MPEKTSISVFGLIGSVNYTRAQIIVQDLFDSHSDVLNSPLCVPLFEFDWKQFLVEKRKELRGEVWTYTEPVMIFIGESLIGGVEEMIAWATENFDDFCDFRPSPLYDIFAKEQYVKKIQESKHIFVYLEMKKDDEAIGRLVIELFNDVVPRASENFRSLCTGEFGKSESTPYPLHYKGSLIHRIVPHGWIQGGDIHDGHGSGGESIYGPLFDDECFAVKHDRAGIVGFANKGPHTNQSQFYITLQPCAWMDAKYEAVGRIVEGFETLEAIQTVETMNERPISQVTVSDCGQLTFEF